ncbi:helix-turn-helix domain-containing protein [Chryseobacterium sp. T16E-39]|uniref:helix-turn-helix domain-containing protein n=1 Tax=Chryseobacterium sp. T16E-39 TaxID=2015076 RepID=UPI001E475393|nr:AraC family transcriptional regulator [Chryseobacterium sp. T16E-39]
MDKNIPQKFESLSDLHKVLGLPKPLHPLVSFINIKDITVQPGEMSETMILNFYKVAYKTEMCNQARYGQNYYDFREGGLIFTAPNQVFESPDGRASSGYILLFHPDFLLSYPIAKKIKEYGFFSYAANEALHLSEQEKETIMAVFAIMEEELKSRIDDFSQDVMIAQIELLVSYSNRFYKRQFITRKAANHSILEKFEEALDQYFNTSSLPEYGIPTVHSLAEKLSISPSYLSDLLRSLTGQGTQQHIHDKLNNLAKEKLSTTQLSISEIAYELGFEHPQSFSKFFKKMTKMSPVEFRESFN